MFKKYFYQIALFALSLLVVQLHAAHYNDSQETSSNQKSFLAYNYTRKESKKQVANKVKPKYFKREKERLEKALKIDKQRYGADHPNTTLLPISL